MKKNNTIYILYKFSENNHRENVGPFYEIKYSFDTYEVFSLEIKKFTTKEDLVNFVLNFLNDSKYVCAKLLSVEDYNLGMETVKHPDEIKTLFENYGTEVLKESSQNKGIFGRFL